MKNNGASLDLAFMIALRNLERYRTELVPQLSPHQRAVMAIKIVALAKSLMLDDATPKPGDVAITSARHPEAP